jgi:uncharacterized Zn-finger protein
MEIPDAKIHENPESGSSNSSMQSSFELKIKENQEVIHHLGSTEVVESHSLEHPPEANELASDSLPALEATKLHDGMLFLGKDCTLSFQSFYDCGFCAERFSKYPLYRSHLRSHLGEKCYRCTVPGCGRLFKLAAEFVDHVRGHGDQLAYRCHVCSDRFTDLNDLNLHQYTHLTDRETRERRPAFECDKCRGKYATADALAYHRETDRHSYPCGLCDRDFAAERFLRKHLTTAHSEGTFACDICGKRLRNEHYLKTHRLIHTGELPFPCEECDKRFNRRDKLKRHMKSHSLVKRFKCPFREHMSCSREFHRLDKLKLHIMTHGAMKPFRCEPCGLGFTRKEHLKTHTEKLHPPPAAGRLQKKTRQKGGTKKET